MPEILKFDHQFRRTNAFLKSHISVFCLTLWGYACIRMEMRARYAAYAENISSVSFVVLLVNGSSVGQRVEYRPVARRMRRDLILRERNEKGGQASLSKRTVAIGSRESGLPREIVRRRMKKPAEPELAFKQIDRFIFEEERSSEASTVFSLAE